MTVFYYTQSYYLDAVLELLQSIKNIATVHLMIELTPESSKSTIIDVDTLDGKDAIMDLSSIMDLLEWKQIEPYLKGLASVKSAIYPSKRGISYSSYQVARHVSSYIDSLRPSIIHFDTISVRALALLPYIDSYPFCISVHDPKPHSGEFSWKTYLAKKIFYKRSKGFIFYSKYALSVFESCKPKYNVSKAAVRLMPYTIFGRLKTPIKVDKADVLFIGRMSKYKGIDILLKAIPFVLEQLPDTQFLLAGRSENYVLPKNLLGKYSNNIKFINRYIFPAEISTLIKNSKFIVCPYRDATQSGVLMTAFALGKTAIVSDAGSFPEYVRDYYTGLICRPDPIDLAKKIILALKDNQYSRFEANVSFEFNGICADENQIRYEEFYKAVLHNYS